MFFKVYKVLKGVKEVVDTATIVAEIVKSVKDKKWNL